MQTEELKIHIKEVLKNSPNPLSPEDIATQVLKGLSNRVPPLYNPAETYRPHQRVYHAGLEQWFIVQKVAVEKQELDAELKDGGQIRLACNSQKQQVKFPATPEAYLAKQFMPQLPIQGTPGEQTEQAKAHLVKLIRSLLPDIPGLYRQDDLWHDRPIESPVQRACRKYQIDCFYHITHIQNLTGILTQGILCRNKLTQGSYCDISEKEIQEHRHLRHIPLYPALTLHDCVPLFFAPKPPMLSARREQQEGIIYLHIDCNVLDLPRVVFTDGNARSNKTKFYNRLEDMKHLDWEILWAEYWGVPDDPEKHNENKRRRAAEVLVPDCVPVSYIQRITVMTDNTYNQVVKILQGAQLEQDISVCIDRNMYF